MTPPPSVVGEFQLTLTRRSSGLSATSLGMPGTRTTAGPPVPGEDPAAVVGEARRTGALTPYVFKVERPRADIAWIGL